MASGVCECGHLSVSHFRWDGRNAACRVKADGTLAAGGSEASGCKCIKYKEDENVS